MITSFSVSAILEARDEISPVLLRLAARFEEIAKLVDNLEKKFAGLGASFGTGVGAKADSMAAGVTAAMGRIDTAIMGTTTRVQALADQMAAVGVAGSRMSARSVAAAAASAGGVGGRAATAEEQAAAAGGGMLAAREGRGGGGFSGFGVGGGSVPLPGGSRFRYAGTPAMVGAAAVGEGVWEEAKVQDFINKIFLTGGISTGDQSKNPLSQQIRDTILKTYVMTGLPLEQLEQGILTGTRGLAGINLEKRLALMPGLLQASATEAYLKEGTTVPQAMNAFVGLAHMEGKYKPEEISKLAGHFAYLSTTTPVSVEQVERAAGYAIPMLRTADFNPEQLLLMITSMERAGITNTKAGTWISQLGMQSFPGTSLMSRMAFAKHESALKQLGLIDEHDKPTWFTDDRPDLVKMTGIAGEHIAAMDPAHRLAIEKALWGQQGGRAAGFFADPTNRSIMAAVAGEEKDFISGEAMWKQSLQNSPMVQFRTSWASFNAALMDTGRLVLPYVTGMLKQANEKLGGGGELLAGAGLLGAWATRGLWAPIVGGWGLRAAGLAGGAPLAALAAAAGGVYEASYLSSPEGARGILAQPDPGAAERARINRVLNPPSGPDDAISAAGAMARRLREQESKGGGLALPAAAAAAPPVNVSTNVSAPLVNVSAYLDSAQIAARIVTEVIPAVASHVISSLGAALHMGNQTNQGPAGGAHDAPSGAGVGP
jgi:hypothetical protein